MQNQENLLYCETVVLGKSLLASLPFSENGRRLNPIEMEYTINSLSPLHKDEESSLKKIGGREKECVFIHYDGESGLYSVEETLACKNFYVNERGKAVDFNRRPKPPNSFITARMFIQPSLGPRYTKSVVVSRLLKSFWHDKASINIRKYFTYLALIYTEGRRRQDILDNSTSISDNSLLNCGSAKRSFSTITFSTGETGVNEIDCFQHPFTIDYANRKQKACSFTSTMGESFESIGFQDLEIGELWNAAFRNEIPLNLAL